jgi:hypothetical protein
MKATRTLLVLGLLFFLAALVALFRVIAGGSGLLWVGLALLGLSVASLAFSAWRLHTRVDFDRIGDEQKLWRSGSLGRLWLRRRGRG